MSIAIVDDAGQDRAVHKLTYGAKIHSIDGTQVKRGTKLFEWDPYTLPIIAEKAGVARFVDLVSGISVREDTDEATGMTQKIVSDWRSAPKGNDLKPEVIIMNPETGEPVRGRDGCADFLWHVGGRHSVGGRWPDHPPRRRGGAYSARGCQDQGHHGRSAARGRIVRSPSSQGSRDHRGSGWLCPLWQGLQEQAPHHGGACGRNADGDGIHGAQGQAYSGAGRRLRAEGRLHHGRQPGPARHLADPGGRGAWPTT